MSNPYWAHCNICALLLPSVDTSLYLLSCGHLLCKACMQQTDRGTKCPLCKLSITFTDLKKCASSKKQNFEAKYWKRFRDSLKSVNYQNAKQIHLVKLSVICKVKIRAAVKRPLKVLKKKLKKVLQTRRLSPIPMKEICMRNQKKASQVVRQPVKRDNAFKFDTKCFNRDVPDTPMDTSSNMSISNAPISSCGSISSFFTPQAGNGIIKSSILSKRDNRRQMKAEISGLTSSFSKMSISDPQCRRSILNCFNNAQTKSSKMFSAIGDLRRMVTIRY